MSTRRCWISAHMSTSLLPAEQSAGLPLSDSASTPIYSHLLQQVYHMFPRLVKRSIWCRSLWHQRQRRVRQTTRPSNSLPREDTSHLGMILFVPQPRRIDLPIPRPRCKWLINCSAHVFKSCWPCLSHGHWFKTTYIQHNANTGSNWSIPDVVCSKMGNHHICLLAAWSCKKRIQAPIFTKPRLVIRSSYRTLVLSDRYQVSCSQLCHTKASRQWSHQHH